MPYKLLIILAALIWQTHSALDLTAFYIIFHNSNTVMPADPNPFSYTFVTTYNYPTHTKAALILAGFDMYSQNIVNFKAWINSFPLTTLTMSIQVFDDLIIYKLGYYVLISNPSSQWIWTFSNNIIPTNLSAYGTLEALQQEFVVPGTLTLFESGHGYTVLPYLYSCSATSLPGTNVRMQIGLVQPIDVNLGVRLKIIRGDNTTQKVAEIFYTVIVANNTDLGIIKIPQYTPMVTLQSNGQGTSNLLQSISTNFGIPSFFKNTDIGGYEEYCMIGFTYLSMAGIATSSARRRILFESRTNSIQILGNSLTHVPLAGNSVYERFIGQYKIVCLRACQLGTYYPNSYPCLPCPPTCLGCYSYNHCFSCQNNYYLTIFNNCSHCNTKLPNCLTCSIDTVLNSYNCTSCDSTFFVGSTNLCQLCSGAIPGCYDCTNSTYCHTCLNNSFTVAFDPLTLACVPCVQVFQKCRFCNNNECLQCVVGFTLHNGACNCLLGELIKGICNQIVGCTYPIQLLGIISCLQCNTTGFQFAPVNHQCLCIVGHLVNGICTDITGCISVIATSGGTQSCLMCDFSQHFLTSPDTTGNCICEPKYHMINSQCVDICGDGYLMNTSSLYCDDGNNIDSDGCSITCLVQIGYGCYNGSSTTPSSCVYQGIPLVAQLTHIERINGLNQGTFIFSLYPPLLNIKKMNLSQIVFLECMSTYQITSVTYQSGMLTITTDYTEDMEGRLCNLTVSYDQTIIKSQITTISFTVQSSNTPLLYSTKTSVYSTIQFIFQILSQVALALFALSLPLKMIGVEVLCNCQLTYLAYCFLKKPSFLFNSFKRFNLVTGYWSLFYQQQYRSLITGFTDRVELSPFFLESSFLVTTIIFISFVIWLLLVIISKCLEPEEINYKQIKIPQTKVDTAVGIVYSWMLFPVTAGFFLVLSLQAYVNNLRLPSSISTFSPILNSLSIIFIFVMLGILIKRETMTPSQVGKVKKVYIFMFLIRSAIIATLMQIGMSSSSLPFYLYPIMIIELVYFVILLILRPYRLIFFNVVLLLSESTILYAFVLILVSNFYTFHEDIQVFVLIILQGLLVLVFILQLIRIFIAFYTNIKTLCRQKQPSQTTKSSDPLENKMKEEQKIFLTSTNAPISAQAQSKDKVSRRRRAYDGRQQRKQDDEQLKIAKQKLRQSLIMTRKKQRQQAQRQFQL